MKSLTARHTIDRATEGSTARSRLANSRGPTILRVPGSVAGYRNDEIGNYVRVPRRAPILVVGNHRAGWEEIVAQHALRLLDSRGGTPFYSYS